MGCSGSKLEGLEDVALCRNRTGLLADAIRHRYALADAHSAYSLSLRSVAASLHRFLDSNAQETLPSSSSSLLPIPPQRKGDPLPPSSSPPHSPSLSGSGSHIQLHSSDEDSSSDDQDSPLHSSLNAETLGSDFVNFHYNQPQPPSVHFNYSDYAYSYDNYYGFLPPPNSAPPPAFAPSKQPPPPPSPPRVSNWDFLNPFGARDNYYPLNTYSLSSREARDEVVKEVKFVGSTSEECNVNEEGIAGVGETLRSVEVENEEGVVEKNVVADEVQRPQNATAASGKSWKYQNVSEIVSEIRVQFEKASEAASELSKMLEVGKHPFCYRKSSVIEVSSRLMCVMPPPSASNGENFLNFEDDMVTSSWNLSSTLQKLYIWEKKLQDEVRAEEKMRLLHDKNCKRLKHLVERGAEAHKLDDVQKLIRKLSTKIRIAIQVVDSISNKINKLRDEELWPQIKELIQGLLRMWKVMLECHRIQCQAISEAKGLDSIATAGKLDDSHLSAMVDLELELLRWTGNFMSWINAQKNYVKALNGWLVLCLHFEPEVTTDGIPPYSPGRIGAPPVFVICNNWSQTVDMISEMEVINAMQAFTTNLRHLWEQHCVDQHQKMMSNGDMDPLVRAREREVQIIHKEVDALNKKLVLVSGQNDLSGHSSGAVNLQLRLKQIFEVMENFAANSLKAHEELHMRSEEESG